MVFSVIKKVLRRNLWLVFVLVIDIAIVVVAGLLPAQIIRVVVDSYLSVGINAGLLVMASYYLLVIAISCLFDFIKQILLVVLGEKITKEIRLTMSTKLRTIRTQYFSDNEYGVIASRFTNDVDAINSMFTEGLIGLVIDLLKICGIIITMFFFDVTFGFITLAAIPVIFVITRIFQHFMLKAQMKSRKLIGKVNNHIAESLRNIRMIKIFSVEPFMKKRYANYLNDNYKAVESVNFLDSLYPPIVVLMRGILIVVIVLAAAGLLGTLSVSVGIVAGSVELMTSLFTPIESLGMELQGIQQSVSGIKRVNEFGNEADEEPKMKITAPEVVPDRSKLVIHFNKVCFGYEKDQVVLADIEITVDALEKATFIGRTGVGKTTLFRLIMGLLKPTSGSITVNGVDVYKIPNEIKHQIFGYVDQSFLSLNGTIKDQITLGNDYSDEMVWQTLDFIGLKAYVSGLEKGFNTPYETGLFSQGERQLLSIGRGIIANPPILLLDEMTANLDSLTEARINAVLEKASLSRTILSISHLLSSINDADKVIYIENGRVRASGSKEEVLSLDDFRKELEIEKLWR
ncbi:MAG: ABC transporter ATP-binding protein [Firmicutes bacterium]|nr:ABC transporter ATP-binding protein [Bacillota bacterium]